MLKELIIITPVDKVPKEWKTTVQWSKEEGLKEAQTGKYLRLGIKRGLIEKKAFNIVSGKRTMKVNHYRIKK